MKEFEPGYKHSYNVDYILVLINERVPFYFAVIAVTKNVKFTRRKKCKKHFFQNILVHNERKMRHQNGELRNLSFTFIW